MAFFCSNVLTSEDRNLAVVFKMDVTIFKQKNFKVAD